MSKKAKLWMVAVFVVIAGLFSFFFAHHGSEPVTEPKMDIPKTTTAEEPEPQAPPKEKFIDVTQITFHPEKPQTLPLSEGNAFNPSVSPDGGRIVFIRKVAGKSSLSFAELPGGTVNHVETSLDDVADPSWNKDGSKIVFSGAHSGVWDIYIYDMNGKTVTQVTRDPKRKKTHPRISPYTFDDHYRIAYTSEENGRKDIWWVRESGEIDQPVTIAPGKTEEFKNAPYWQTTGIATAPEPLTKGGESPEWSSSGTLLSYRTSKGCIFLSYKYSTWWKESIIQPPTSQGSLSWAPNQISFLSFDQKTGTAAIIPRDSRKPKSILKGKHLTSPPVFFPDGQGFAFTCQENGRSILAVEPYSDPLGDITNLWMFPLNHRQKDKLKKNQLLLLDAENDQIYSIYDTERYSCGEDVEMGFHARPYLVTSDAVLETFYAVFATVYATVEREELVGALKEFASKSAKVAHGKKGAEDLENMFLTGLALLKPDAAKTMPPIVREEVKKIEEASGEGVSFFGMKVNYSDFFIRGKYERDKDLQGYFRAVKWFQAFTFKLDNETERKQASHILNVVNSPEIRPALEGIYSLYRDMIGESRYYSPLILKEMPLSGPLPDVPPPLPWITQQNKFRLFPPIYTLDAHIFDELIWHLSWPESVEGRFLPMGLDIMAAFGSSEARKILVDELKENQYKNYEKRLAMVTEKIGAFPSDAWEASLYQNWLHALNALVIEPPSGSPSFTKTSAWKRKQLNTALASWVNLRYETIAMVEQIGAECGEGGYEVLNAGKPRGYVEPNPLFFQRMNHGFGNVATLMGRTIKNQELKKSVLDTLTVFRQHLTVLETIARKELEGKPLTDSEYSEILNIGGTIEHFILCMGSLKGKCDDYPISNPEPVRKIVDVQEDRGTRLYEAQGFVNEINVAVPFYGRRQLVKGPVYSYYEFTSQKNLDSAAWKKMEKQAKPVWISPLYEGESTSSLSTLPDLN